MIIVSQTAQTSDAWDSYEARRARAVERGHVEQRAWLARLPVIARNLGPDWTATPFVRRPNEDESYDVARACYLTREDGLRVHLPVPWEQWRGTDGTPQRISISVAWPQKTSGGGGWTWRDVATYEERGAPLKGISGITLRPEATDIDITKAIRSRLLPVCEPFFRRMVQYNAEHAREASEARRVHQALCARYGLEYTEPRDTSSRERAIWARVGGVDRLVISYDAKIDIHLDRLPFEQAIRVLDVLLPVVGRAS
jgi:hypothetical protein